MEKKIGEYSFIIGVVLAIILGLATGSSVVRAALAGTEVWLTSILVILGLIVGFINVTGKDTKDFLMIATILVVVSFAGGSTQELAGVSLIGPYIAGIFSQIMAFVVPATVVVGLKEIYYLARMP